MGRRDEARTILIGAAGGALVGALLAVLYRRVRQRRSASAKPITTGQVVRLGAALVPILRQFIELLS